MTFPRPTPEQLARSRRIYWQWWGTVTPCGISHVEIYNPCLPEEIDGKLTCLTCGLKQRLELTSGTLDV
jgi:hypothetical protein